jgi:hypothetical protein
MEKGTRTALSLAILLALATAFVASASGAAQAQDNAAGGPANERPNAAPAEALEDVCGERGEAPNPADFSANVTNPYFPLPVGMTRVYEGVDEGTPLRVEERVLRQTSTVAGIEVRVLEVNEFEDGELFEHTLDFHNQHVSGAECYFGELVDMIEDGEVVGHEGQWLAYEGRNLPGLFMPAPADIAVGVTFEQERAPRVAEDVSEIVAVGLTVTVEAGTFTDCIRTEDFNPLDRATEFKTYCPGVGLVLEEAEGVFVELVRIHIPGP